MAHPAQRDDHRGRHPTAAGGLRDRTLKLAQTAENYGNAFAVLRVAGVGQGVDGGRVHVHRGIDEADNDWGFSVIRHDFRHDPSTPSEKTGNDPGVGRGRRQPSADSRPGQPLWRNGF
ncbi:Uncharacterised protein [Mycobacteroides abscessus subsp. abscessus]|nr:Uncharacterised protein [Mycobacteroides abscessus subsp. abscessus]